MLYFQWIHLMILSIQLWLVIEASLYLTVAVDHITQAFDHGLITCEAFLDLYKAFYSLDHHILLQRLHEHGVSGDVLTWFTDHLCNNYEMVNLDHWYATWGVVRGGIPLSSALSPYSFSFLQV